MAYKFYNRTRELEALEAAWSSEAAMLALVWGRRRAGKTRLLGTFVDGKRAIFYGATQQASATELRAFADTVRVALQPSGSDLLALGDFPSWAAAFEYLSEHAASERLAVVLDEFPYLVEGEPALPSIIQRFWDHTGRESRLMMVLCGSELSAMEELQGRHAPLFGRVDLRLHLDPLAHGDAALFTPHLKPSELATTFAILGGMPVYLERWDEKLGLTANLHRLFGDPTSPLVDEGEFVLSSELPEGSGYFRIMLAIALGHRTYGAIRDFAHIDIQRQLDRLRSLGLVDRVVPVTEDPSRSKRVIYRIADNFLSFWFRFIYRNRADISRGLGREVIDRAVLPNLSDYMGEPWEEMCREFVRHRAASGDFPVELSAVGRWWNTDSSVEIDVVGIRGPEVALAGSVKWSRTSGPHELRALRRAAEAIPRRADDLQFVLFAREEIQDIEDSVLQFTAADLCARP